MPRECLAITESKSKVRNSRNKLVVAKVSTNTSTFGISHDVAELKDMVKALLLDKKSQNQAPATVKAVEESCPRKYQLSSSDDIKSNPTSWFSSRSKQSECSTQSKEQSKPFQSKSKSRKQFQSRTWLSTPGFPTSSLLSSYLSSSGSSNTSASTSSSGTLPSNTIANPRSDLNAITTRNGLSYDGPQIPPPPSFLPKVVENKPEATKDTMHPTNNGSTEDVQPPMKLRDKANDQREKIFQILKDLNFNISFADALILMPKFGPLIKSLLTNKDKLCELARTPLNEHCSVVLLKKFSEKPGDPGKFLIPCDFPGKAQCLALADLGASINLMPLSMWNKLSLLDLTPTCMTLELADRSISLPVGVAEDVYVKVGTFHFSADFIVVDFDTDPRVPLILERSFLKNGRALIDMFKGELTLRVGKEAITFNLDQTLRYSANYSDMMAKRIDVIDMACEEYLQEVLEVDAFLALDDDPTSPEVDQSYLDSKGDILLLEGFLNDDPSPPPNQGNYLSEVRKELKIYEAKSDKSSIDEPPEVELKDLPPHLEYAFLEGDNKLPVIITKDLNVEEKTALITVLKSHKRAIAWKLSDIKGIDPEFCTHNMLMEEDFEPAVLKLLDAGLIYPTFDSPWVSPVHRVPKKGSFTVVENEDNELILTRLVTGWRVCIDYCKLNEANRKDHFPLPFMDQMLERLAGNQYFCFLDGFFGYFQIPIDPKDHEKTTFTYPYETFAYRRMPFGLCNAPGT
nr:reverse transcriptase domain-containing protein [Tanacetum cinerariifolium]